MNATFPERIEQKAAMLRAVREGVEIATMPAQEPVTDDAVSTSVHSAEIGAIHRLPRARSHRGWWLGAGIVLMTGGAFGVRDRWATSHKTPAVSVPAPPPPVSDALPAPTLAPHDVSITIESVPPLAVVSIAGRVRCETPCTFSLPYGKKSVPIALELAGWRSSVEAVVPSVDQKLKLSLSPVPKTSTKRPPGPRSFRRFD